MSSIVQFFLCEFDFRTLDFCKTGVENQQQGFGGSSYFSITRVFLNRTIPGEMASDALWVVCFKCVVKGYQECRFDVKEGEEFKVLKKIVEKGRAFLVVNERGRS